MSDEKNKGAAGTQALMKTGSEMQRHDAMGGTEVAPIVETQTAALEVQARAEVEARYVMAVRRPRDMDTVRIRMLKECQRPGFAEISRYKIPNRGEGWTIRFAEQARRLMGNLDVSARIIYDDPQKRIVRVTASDLETNAHESVEVVVEKTVERKPNNLGGRPILGTRNNSYGDVVHVVPATDDELPAKQNSLVSKARRNAILAFLPGDISDDCKAAVRVTLTDRAAKDPNAERRRICDSFAEINVLPDQLKAYLGHPIDTSSPAEIAELRQLFAAVREGATNWTEIMQARVAERGSGDGAEGANRTAPPTSIADIKNRANKGAGAKGAATPQPQPGATCTGCVLPHGIVGGCPVHDAATPPEPGSEN